MFCAFYMHMPLFRWKVSDHEKSTAYYKSLMLEDTVREDREDVMEEGDASILQSKTRTRFIGSRNSDEPTSKKKLFDGDVEILKSKFKTSVSYTIPELYTFIAQLVTQKIKESKERMKSWITEEIGKIAKENKVGDISTPKNQEKARRMIWIWMTTIGWMRWDDSFFNEIHDGVSDLEEKDQRGVETVVDIVVEKAKDKSVIEKAEGERADGKQPICVDEFPIPEVNMVGARELLTILPSVICDEFPDPNVVYKNQDKKRTRRGWFLQTQYADPMAKKKKKEEIRMP
ncbi:hypothetical protein LWI28_026014 [Acer negundo]|uniref:Uncharacterized protein n=1 Tax=Acer negundo TaxID=4023 RepID=A0AAD5J1B6_ACENE|nr:hypothetical protein LWI28_026014 [Acer negundo]